MIGAIKGYSVIITVSEKISKEKLNTIRAYGAQVVMCPPTRFDDDERSYQSTAQRIHKQTPNSFMLNQYYNESNRHAHYHSLGPDIWQQTGGKLTHFIAAAGSGGTISGAGQYLKEQNNTVAVYGVDSCNSYRSTHGNPQPYCLEGIGVDIDSTVIKYEFIDRVITVTDADAITMLKKLARQGLLVGPSSGAAAWAVTACADILKPTDVLVVIFGDSGRAYLTKDFY